MLYFVAAVKRKEMNKQTPPKYYAAVENLTF